MLEISWALLAVWEFSTLASGDCTAMWTQSAGDCGDCVRTDEDACRTAFMRSFVVLA
jgi:hypothetical protein